MGTGFLDALIDVIRQGMATQEPMEGDYVQDGVIYCGTCHQPKQSALAGTDLLVPVPCDCIRREQERLRREDEARAVAHNRKRCFDEPHPEQLDPDDTSKAAIAARGFVEHFREFYRDGKGLMFYGPVGTGKTYLAAGIANAILDKGWSCRMTTVSDVARLMGSTYDGKQDVLDDLKRYRLLILDDFGAQRDTEYMNETVFDIINARYECRRPLIVTTNLTREQLAKPTGLATDRVYSRVLEMCPFAYEVSGRDRRMQIARQAKRDLGRYLE